MYLTALFVAACAGSAVNRKTYSNTRPLRRSDPGDPPGWADLLVIPARAEAVKERVGPAENRLRQIKYSLDRLQALGLVSLGATGTKDRYEGFVVHPETGLGDYADPLRYRVPTVDASFTVPVEFFLNGWLWALTNSEVAAYLMFRYLAWQNPNAHGSTGIFVTGGDREDHFALSRDAYESHLMLANYGLLACHPAGNRTSTGQWAGYVPGGRLEAHRFTLLDAGLKEPAIERVLAEL